MVLHGAVIIEQGVKFALLSVKQSVTQYTVRSTRFRQAVRPFSLTCLLFSCPRTKMVSPTTMDARTLWNF